MNTPSLRRPKLSVLKAKRAFSLIELLVVIAVIGIIAAIAIPNIANLTGGATIAKNQRNAQNLASVFSAAVAAGYVPTGITTPGAAVDALTDTDGVAGATPAGGTAPTFRVPNLSEDDKDGAEGFLTFADGQLVYNSAGNAAPSATP